MIEQGLSDAFHFAADLQVSDVVSVLLKFRVVRSHVAVDLLDRLQQFDQHFQSGLPLLGYQIVGLAAKIPMHTLPNTQGAM